MERPRQSQPLAPAIAHHGTLLMAASDAVILAAFLAAASFVVLYSLWYRWWRDPAGRLIALLDAALALALLPGAVHAVFRVPDDSLGWRILASAAILGAAVVCTSRIWWVWRLRRRNISLGGESR